MKRRRPSRNTKSRLSKRSRRDDEDRISSLPDDLRIRILSHLSTRSAVTTGALSKRWARLWTRSPFITLDQCEFATAADFVHFADSAMAACGDILRFELYWQRGFDISKTNDWLNQAIARGVRRISLQISLPDWCATLELPSALFNSPCLEIFRMNALEGKRYIPLQLPGSVRLSSIRCLDISPIFVTAGFLAELLLNCPVLEELSVGVFGRASFRASAPNLRMVRIFSTMKDMESSIQISAPRLEALMVIFRKRSFVRNCRRPCHEGEGGEEWSEWSQSCPSSGSIGEATLGQGGAIAH